MRSVLLAAGAAGVLLLSACGSSDPAAVGSVHLEVTAPSDLRTVRAATVQVQGTVRPSAAQVTVAGRRASVTGGTFRAAVPLEAGINVIDVLASAGDARPALTAVRVRRVVEVTVPDLSGLSPDDATMQLEALGLKSDVRQQGGGLLDDIFGSGDPKVCDTDPGGGSRADAGTTVTVTTSTSC